ncbi:MAG: divergent PAP2 family protein [Clostridia bacterium]|nr:divergent PAP2 family protein [Clostridia bacterium]MCI9413014.1 divergent PAP2 family protein [Clostridia bacterium]
MTFIREYRYILVPFGVWFGIQLFKLLYDIVKEKKFNFKRIMQAGGMPSSHSAVVVVLTTMIAKAEGLTSPVFGVSLIFSFVVMYDAAGVRRAAGKQAKLLNKIVETPGLSGVEVSERLVEVLGHTPVQVIVGAVIGLIVGLII